MSKQPKQKPAARFRGAFYECSEQPEWVYFYSIDEARKYLQRLPKDWLVELLLCAPGKGAKMTNQPKQNSIIKKAILRDKLLLGLHLFAIVLVVYIALLIGGK